jgi:hypothetical protein
MVVTIQPAHETQNGGNSTVGNQDNPGNHSQCLQELAWG